MVPLLASYIARDGKRCRSHRRFPRPAEAVEMAWIEALHVEDRVQHKPALGPDMPLGIGVRLTIYKAFERLDFAREQSASLFTQLWRHQTADNDLTVFAIEPTNPRRLIEKKICLFIALRFVGITAQRDLRGCLRQRFCHHDARPQWISRPGIQVLPQSRRSSSSKAIRASAVLR